MLHRGSGVGPGTTVVPSAPLPLSLPLPLPSSDSAVLDVTGVDDSVVLANCDDVVGVSDAVVHPTRTMVATVARPHGHVRPILPAAVERAVDNVANKAQ